MATETKPIKSISKFVEPWKGKEGNLIMILHSMQNYYGYIPKEEAYKLSQELKIPLARIYEVLTFYNYFSLEPPAKYKVSVCMGTACYLQGAPELIKKFESDFKEILSNFQKLDKISVDGIKPSFHPIELKNVMREDIEGKCLDNENALSNSAHKSEGYFKGPKII